MQKTAKWENQMRNSSFDMFSGGSSKDPGVCRNRNRKYRHLYCRYRRFHEKWDGISEAVVRKSRELINELEKSGMMEARALLDDLRVICTGEDSSFEEPEEYMERMKEK